RHGPSVRLLQADAREERRGDTVVRRCEDVRGLRRVRRHGEHLRFGKLSHLVSQVGVEKLNRRYATNWSDAQTLTVSVTTGRETITIADYGGAGPVQLGSIEEAMMAIGHDIVWKRK